MHCSIGAYVTSNALGAGKGMLRIMKRLLLLNLPNRYLLKDVLRRVDRAAADLNVLLIVIAIGLAALDVTFLVTQKVVDRLPTVTRVVYDSPQSAVTP